MGAALPSLRLTGGPPGLDAPAAPAQLLRQVSDLQAEIDSLRCEIEMLRHRDDTLRFYMNRIDEELRLAAKLQQDFLPRTLPRLGPVSFETLFRPAGYVSGDLYDVMRLDETHLGIFVCDAVGHGMPAALLTMFIKRALVTKEIFPQGGYRLLRPFETLTKLNQALVDQNLSQASYVTALYGIIDTTTLHFELARGGHPSPALMRPDGTLDFINANGALLGIFPDEPFESVSRQLQRGDRLLFYSDGVEVAFGEENVADTHRWQKEVQQRSHLSSAEFVTDLGHEIDRQVGSLRPKDDLTVIVMEIQPHPA